MSKINVPSPSELMKQMKDFNEKFGAALRDAGLEGPSAPSRQLTNRAGDTFCETHVHQNPDYYCSFAAGGTYDHCVKECVQTGWSYKLHDEYIRRQDAIRKRRFGER